MRRIRFGKYCPKHDCNGSDSLTRKCCIPNDSMPNWSTNQCPLYPFIKGDMNKKERNRQRRINKLIELSTQMINILNQPPIPKLKVKKIEIEYSSNIIKYWL